MVLHPGGNCIEVPDLIWGGMRKIQTHANKGENLPRRPLTPTYILFYILFLPDTWQILVGLFAAYILAPRATSPQTGLFGSIMLYIMIATIGYAASRLPARAVTGLIKKWILGDRQPS
jgi:hypothetical protein